jgi:hypothetical protein
MCLALKCSQEQIDKCVTEYLAVYYGEAKLTHKMNHYMHCTFMLHSGRVNNIHAFLISI